MNVLNDMAYRRGLECHAEVEWLKRRLQGLNYGQSLGISIWSVVIDRKTLATIAIAISSGIVTVVTALLALSEDTAVSPPVAQRARCRRPTRP